MGLLDVTPRLRNTARRSTTSPAVRSVMVAPPVESAVNTNQSLPPPPVSVRLPAPLKMMSSPGEPATGVVAVVAVMIL